MSIHDEIDEVRKAHNSTYRDIIKFRAYVNGDQKSTLTTAQHVMLRGVTGNKHCDNVCKKIINETANRLKLLGFRTSSDYITNFLQDFYTLNLMAKFSSDVLFSTLRDGNFVVSLSWDENKGTVRLSKEQWFNGKYGTFVVYDDYGNARYAVKDWKNSDGNTRRVIWYPDRIERFISAGMGWEWYSDPINGLIAQERWVRSDGSPIGLPFVHFSNSTWNDSFYGQSELDGGVLGLQDEINDTQRDITTAARMTAYQMMYATGITLPEDELGNPIPPHLAPGAVFTAANADAKFGTLSAGDLSQLQAAYMVKLQAVSRMTDTPIHSITGGDWPSGEALMKVEQPLISKVEKLADSVGPSWASIAHKATVLANVFSNAGLNETEMISAVFAPITRREPLAVAQTAQILANYVSEREVLRVLNYTEAQIDTILAERQEESTQEHLLGLGDVIPNAQQ